MHRARREKPGPGYLRGDDHARRSAPPPLTEIARELRDRRATARELVDAAIARHESVGERLHAYSFWAPEQARAVPTRPMLHSPLTGIPALPDRAGDCRRIPGSRTDRLWRRYVASLV